MALEFARNVDAGRIEQLFPERNVNYVLTSPKRY
jgi:hypothetical protein